MPIVPAQNNQTMPQATQPDAEQSPKAASELVAGGRSWSLNFTDRTLSELDQRRIVYDLNLLFGHLPKFEIDTLPLPLEVDGIQLDRRVRFEGGSNRRPNVLMNSGFAHLARGKGDADLLVPKTITDAYLKAIDLENQHKTELRQLDEFLARMSEIKERPIENVRELFVVADDFKSAEADLSAIPPDGFAEAWGGKRYREPSILDVTATTGTPLEKYGSLVATTYAMTSDKLEDLPLLVFNQGRWRFLLQRPPQ